MRAEQPKQQAMVFDTIGLNKTERKKLEKLAASQDKMVLQIFAKQPSGEVMTPLEVYRHIVFEVKKGNPRATVPLIQSVRRSITTLTTRGLLQKTQYTRMEQYHARNHGWKLNTAAALPYNLQHQHSTPTTPTTPTTPQP